MLKLWVNIGFISKSERISIEILLFLDEKIEISTLLQYYRLKIYYFELKFSNESEFVDKLLDNFILLENEKSRADQLNLLIYIYKEKLIRKDHNTLELLGIKKFEDVNENDILNLVKDDDVKLLKGIEKELDDSYKTVLSQMNIENDFNKNKNDKSQSLCQRELFFIDKYSDASFNINVSELISMGLNTKENRENIKILNNPLILNKNLNDNIEDKLNENNLRNEVNCDVIEDDIDGESID